MPSESKHLEQYKKNKELAFSDVMCNQINNDWKVTILFYAALHKLDSHYASLYHPKSHKERKNFLYSTKKYNDVIDEYEYLEELSRNARYSCIKVKKKEIEEAEELLSYIEKFVENKKD